MGARLIGSVGDLARDLEGIASKAVAELPVVVHQNVEQGKFAARGIAKKASGRRHGTAYYKRITSEMTGRLAGEYGPTGDVVGNAVGAGWRHGRNTDLPKSLDVQGPKFGDAVGKRVDSWFW